LGEKNLSFLHIERIFFYKNLWSFKHLPVQYKNIVLEIEISSFLWFLYLVKVSREITFMKTKQVKRDQIFNKFF
jgi:hypothetical protein